MKKVSLTLIGLNSEVSKSEVLTALSNLYGKPESHFEQHCEHLFELNTSFVHIKKISSDEAARHQERLEAIGIKTAIAEVAGSSGLSLVPVEEKAGPAPECPSCDQVTTDTEMCSVCGVMIKKFLEQKAIDEKFQKKLASAERSNQRIQEARDAEDQRRKDAKARKTDTEETPEVENPSEPEPDHIRAKVEEKSNKKVLYFAGAALVASVIGSSYFILQMRDNLAQKEQYDYATVDGNVDSAVVAAANSSSDQEPAPLVENSSFSDWNYKISQVEKLQNNMDILNNTVGMSSTMEGLLAQTQDPFVRIMGTQHLVKLKMQKSETSQLTDEAESGQSYGDLLANTSILIMSLHLRTEQLYAHLGLAQTYTDLEQATLAASALEMAKLSAIAIANRNNTADKIIAEVISAEYFVSNGVTEKMHEHYKRAEDFSKQLEPDSEDAKWAIPFIVRSQASNDQYVDAYALLENVQDPKVVEMVMKDISKYATEEQTESSDTTNIIVPAEFANDPDLQLLYENQRKMQQNAKLLSGFSEK